MSDVVAEGFSPGVLQRLGLGYDVLKSLRPDMIYVQQSGMGGVGTYGRFRTIGPVAAAFAGTSEMSGLPEPAMPAGWGYSFLDWIGAYSFATAIMGALSTIATARGRGSGSTVPNASPASSSAACRCWTGRQTDAIWSRIGNRSPYKPAAPHGAYRCAGTDRWIAIACFDAGRSGRPSHAPPAGPTGSPIRASPRSKAAIAAPGRARRRRHRMDRDARRRYACMDALQKAGVAAGVCQNAEDRCDHDPQLAALNWFTEVTGTKIGRWPVTELPMKLAATPPYSGGIIDRGAPGYGEDNARILGEMLGYSAEQVTALAEEGVI
jgi:crotonobetainyl-CoA:carnitine CoA-transferase CaiB-like acyl-CoA transferase